MEETKKKKKSTESKERCGFCFLFIPFQSLPLSPIMSECLLYIFLSASAVMQKFAMETWIEKEGEREGGGGKAAHIRESGTGAGESATPHREGG